MLLQNEHGCHPCWLLVHSPPLEREKDTLRVRDSSTQHVRGKQFIFLPQLLTGGKHKMSLGSSADELFTATGKFTTAELKCLRGKHCRTRSPERSSSQKSRSKPEGGNPTSFVFVEQPLRPLMKKRTEKEKGNQLHQLSWSQTARTSCHTHLLSEQQGC